MANKNKDSLGDLQALMATHKAKVAASQSASASITSTPSPAAPAPSAAAITTQTSLESPSKYHVPAPAAPAATSLQPNRRLTVPFTPAEIEKLYMLLAHAQQQLHLRLTMSDIIRTAFMRISLQQPVTRDEIAALYALDGRRNRGNQHQSRW